MEYYEATYRCLNCNNVFKRNIPKGNISEGKGGSCPKCEVDKNESVQVNEMIMPDGKQILHG